jgi:hypothetical protein
MAFRVTKAWIESVGHPVNGAWSQKQLEAVDYDWPPPPGWKTILLQRTISDAQKLAVERARKKRTAHETMQRQKYEQKSEQEMFYTWPDGRGGWDESSTKPEWWDRFSTQDLIEGKHLGETSRRDGAEVK